jgi:predicted nucleic acid-binding protein
MPINLTATAEWIDGLCKSLDVYPDAIRGVVEAKVDLTAASAVCLQGNLDGALLRTILACHDLGMAIGQAKHYWDLRNEIRRALEQLPKAYLDTNIVSAMVRNDIAPDELTALARLMNGFQKSEIDLCTSIKTKQEIEQIPDRYKGQRGEQMRIFSLIRLASANKGDVGAEEALALPAGLDDTDRQHVAEAIRGEANYFVTVDAGILRLRPDINNILVMKPSELVERLALNP